MRAPVPTTEPEIRPFDVADRGAVLDLWRRSGILGPRAQPERDIERKRAAQPELFLVGALAGRVVGTVMAGWDGHRGWIYYLAVDPDAQGRGVGARLLEAAERRLVALGCPKINLQVRGGNENVVGFYEKRGYTAEPRVSMGKRLGGRGA
jgi:ribosomal protein S18 acetylase RimI-like enzyme